MYLSLRDRTANGFKTHENLGLERFKLTHKTFEHSSFVVTVISYQASQFSQGMVCLEGFMEDLCVHINQVE
jgi:hypothetical protein